MNHLLTIINYELQKLNSIFLKPNCIILNEHTIEKLLDWNEHIVGTNIDKKNLKLFGLDILESKDVPIDKFKIGF